MYKTVTNVAAFILTINICTSPAPLVTPRSNPTGKVNDHYKVIRIPIVRQPRGDLGYPTSTTKYYLNVVRSDQVEQSF
jgi:hypothetical protein